jgi:hypothetical protein
MASLELRNEEAWVRLTRSDHIWALKRDVVIPYPSIISVEVCPKSAVERGWLRVGTNWPGRIHKGRYRNRREPWDLWLVGNPEQVLVLTLRDHPFGRIVLELDDPDAVAVDLRKRA